jgi:predicted nucleic acid-binding protein
LSHYTVLYDACVLYPAPIRDFLMHLALSGLFRARWTNQIHEEWISSLLEKRKDLTREKLVRTRDLMNVHAEECLVSDYEHLIDNINLPDPDDRHVLAAAIKCSASVIVTYNMKDFPLSEISKYDVEAQDPDTFIMHLLDIDTGAVCSAVKRQRSNLKNPPKNVSEFLEILASHRLPQTCSCLQSFKGLIAIIFLLIQLHRSGEGRGTDQTAFKSK